MTTFEEFKKTLAPELTERAEKRAMTIVMTLKKRGICDPDTLSTQGCQCGDC